MIQIVDHTDGIFDLIRSCEAICSSRELLSKEMSMHIEALETILEHEAFRRRIGTLN